MEELSAIAGHKLNREHVILIDDAREFTGGAYHTMAMLRCWAHVQNYETLEVEGDIIRIYNPREDEMTRRNHLMNARRSP